MSKGQTAKEIFKQGYNCAQAVLMAYAGDFGLDKKTAASLSAGLGGGIARMRDTCGAVVGAVMVLGLKYSEGSADDKKKIYEISQKFVKEFRENNGSYICRELLALAKNEKTSPKPEERTSEYYSARPCAELVEYAAELLQKYI